ncbi:porin [Mucilaginibacter sp. 14171R-50]|uniref:porin n=1 Tax=Mucilaginibacter sp. 14171R-50 TaxID=2703789 RepID=UPI00138CA53D|nr:porin [Mucilaginibacter sp. 14171R-50]QHS54652.1 porin [Mucilaginibacter sp. 14171R-50]
MKKIIITFIAALSTTFLFAQDTTKTSSPLVISGSADTYYKYDLSGHNNIPTSFASDHNSFSIGMIDLGAKKKVNKALFVGELSFGPRGEGQSIPNAGTNGQSFHIQNLYVGYDITNKLNITGGYMATFLGYEVVSPIGNFNYSTSYLFTNGPFQNAGVKLTYAFNNKVSLMAGVFNDLWNVYTSAGRVNTFGGQLMIAPVRGWTAYLNVLAGPSSGTEFDLTTNYQITNEFKLGLNAADFKASGSGERGGFSGVALYPQYAVSSAVILGLRGEYFETKNGADISAAAPMPGNPVTSFTLTANIKSGPLTFIPEVRLDSMKNNFFTDSNGVATKSASQVLVAAVYAF